MNQIYIRGNEIATKAYVDSLSLGGDGSALDNYYTKEEVNELIEENSSTGGNADLTNYYTKEEINNIISETNNSTQVEEMPEPSEENKGTIVQYIGDTNNTYVTGYFYQVVEKTIINEDGSETTIYVWEEILTPEINLDDYATKEYIYELLSNSNGLIDVEKTTIDSDTFNNMKTGDIYRLVNSNTRVYYNGTLSISTNYANALLIGSTFPLLIDGNNITCLVGGSKYTLNMTKIVDTDTVLTKTNTTTYTPTANYHPATKKYVDDTIAANAGGDKLSDYDIYTIELPHNLKGTYPNITDEESLTKFNQILTNIYRRKIITNSDYYKSFIIVYSQSDTFIFLCSNLGTYCNLYGTYIDEPIDNNGYTCAYKMYITGSLDETAQTYKATSVKFDRDSKRVLLTNNTLTFTPTSNYHPATKKYVDDTIATSIAGISTTSMNITTSLPTENISTSTIYLIKDETASTDSENVHNEYVYINGK